MSVSTPTVHHQRFPMSAFAVAGLLAIAGAGIVAAVVNESDSSVPTRTRALEIEAPAGYPDDYDAASPSDHRYQLPNLVAEPQDPLVTRFGK
jgi:hypothetical protein